MADPEKTFSDILMPCFRELVKDFWQGHKHDLQMNKQLFLWLLLA